jgi:hypothetical protein
MADWNQGRTARWCESGGGIASSGCFVRSIKDWLPDELVFIPVLVGHFPVVRFIERV